MSTSRWRNGTIASAIAVAALLVVGLLVGASTKSKASAHQAVSQDIINALTVRTATVDCTTLSGVKTVHSGATTLVSYDIGALKGTPPRKWSDALSTPLSGSSDTQRVENLQAAICSDPLLGASYANMFANLKVDNVSVGSLNPWLSPFTGASDINDQAASYVTLLDVKNPTSDQTAAAVKQNVAWQQVANKLDTLLARFQVAGVQTLPSVQNWHLMAGGLVVGGLPEVGLNAHQESLPALVLQITEKGACAPLKMIGINTGDMRPEVFATPTCKAPPKVTPKSTPKVTLPPTSSKTPTPSPSHTPTPTPSHSKCPCVPTPSASQLVPTPAPNPPGASVSSSPSAQPTQPAPTPNRSSDPGQSSAPSPTPGGYNGGSSSQPATTAPPTPVSSATKTGDPGRP